MKQLRQLTLSLFKLVLITGIVILSWGLIEPYVLDKEEHDAEITNLPSDWQEEKIAVVGDFQVGMWLDNTVAIRWMVDDLLEMEPAAILLTGDFIYKVESGSEKEIDEIIELLRPLGESTIPLYGVLGNHDYAMELKEDKPDVELAEALVKALEEVNIDMLENENVVIPHETATEELHLVAVGSHWAGRDDPRKALFTLDEDAARFTLMHNPDTFATFPEGSAPIAVAGHTHGGQFRVPFFEASYLQMMQPGNIQVAGWIEEYADADNRLYVNRGIGFSLIPLRIGTRPEITVFTLKNKE
ncbi:metallophosphoesterase [Lacticigenium naphthae]|uniref:metallophosphoesterase n=1 Tax=Lacticigenium naphthae TaxID=515351 RepID=UPI00041DE42D|nr:metallophosphoesterase [Lacticigenium naphthae]